LIYKWEDMAMFVIRNMWYKGMVVIKTLKEAYTG
jgi:hypothetical protein